MIYLFGELRFCLKNTHTHSLTQAQTLSHTYKYSLHISYPNSCKGPHIHDDPFLAHPMQWLGNIGFSGGGYGGLSKTWTEITLYQADNPQKHELKLLCTRQTTTVYYYHQDLLADTLQHSGADAQFTKQPQYMILEKVVPMLNNTGMYNAEELKWIFQQLCRGIKEGGLLKEERRPSMVH